MELFSIFFQSLFFLSLILFLLFLLGDLFFILLAKFDSARKSPDYIFIQPIVGLSILCILSNYLYFLFDFKSQYIYFFYLTLSILLFFFKTNKKILVINFFTVLKKIIPITTLLIFFSLLKGEQFYIFRGNYWDNMTYLSMAILINDFSFSEILSIRSQYSSDHSYVEHGSGPIVTRPLTTFFLAGFFYTKISSFFYLSFLFKIFLLQLIFLSFYFLTKKIKLKYNYFLSLCFVFSFWVLYIFEIEALSHLNAVPFFLICVALILKFKKEFIYNKISDYSIFLILNIAFFFLYPEFFSVFVIVILFFLFFNYDFYFFKKNILKFFLLFFLFIVITLPNYSTTYASLVNQIIIGTSKNINFWGYFSAFFIGKDNEYLTVENILYIKNIFSNTNNNFFYILQEIQFILSQVDYSLVLLNLLPSFFGLYYLTISVFNNYSDIFFLTLIIILNLIIIKTLFKNIIFVFYGKSILSRLIKSFIVTFVIFAILLILNRGYWAFTKLYIYFGPVIFILISTNFYKKKKNIFGLNYWYIILLILFPIYKFYPDNYGIGRLDSFPSIINPIYKKNINWQLEKSSLDNCDIVSIVSYDPIIRGYISIKLRFFGYKRDVINIYKINNNNLNNNNLINNNLNNTSCEVNLLEKSFFIKKF